jgi:hypothetical protein
MTQLDIAFFCRRRHDPSGEVDMMLRLDDPLTGSLVQGSAQV